MDHPKTGRRIIFQTMKTPIFDAGGTLIGVLGIGRDMTEQKRLLEEQGRLQAELLQSQKMESVGRLAGNVAHDYNNMLGVILGSAELALLRMPPGQPERKQLEEIVRAASHSADLTRQLLAFSRKQQWNPRQVDLNEAITSMLGVLQRLAGPDIELAWTPMPGLSPTLVDPIHLDQMLANLVTNARDAVGPGGCIDISAANLVLTEQDCASIPDGLPGDYVQLRVADNGCGMTLDMMGSIFEPFFTTKAPGKGTGLGLAMVHGAVKQNHGAIRVDSRPGGGTCFSIFLPRA